MVHEIVCYPNPKTGTWIAHVRRDGVDICWVFRKTQEEAVAWAEKNIQVYARGKTPAYG